MAGSRAGTPSPLPVCGIFALGLSSPDTEAKLSGFKADLPCSPLVCTAPVPRRHFLYGLINSKAGLAGGRAPADPCLPLSPVSGRSRTLSGMLGEDFVLETSW